MAHRIRFPLPPRVLANVMVRVQRGEGCWLWQGQKQRDGYGQFTFKYERRLHTVMAHRAVWEATYGSVPDELDHICNVRDCVNPAHLRPTTRRENTLRGSGFSAVNARKTHCPRGHEFTPENTLRNGKAQPRRCRICTLAQSRDRKRRLRMMRAS